MAGRKQKPKELAEPEMDMTPMIDVTFLLLIFFLCMEFKTLESKLSANLPKDVGVCPKDAEPMEKLDIRIEALEWGRELPDPDGRNRIVLVGHKVKWFVGPQEFKNKRIFYRLLEQEAKVLQRSKKTNKMEARPITIKIGKGVTYGDVTWVIDMAKYAGFETITFGGGAGARKATK